MHVSALDVTRHRFFYAARSDWNPDSPVCDCRHVSADMLKEHIATGHFDIGDRLYPSFAEEQQEDKQ